MKKSFILFAAILSFAVIITSCGFKDMEIPQTVSIKTDAVYEFPIINLGSDAIKNKFDLSSMLDIEKLLGSEDGSESSFEVYKYNNGSQFQQFLFHMPLSKFEFDFSKSFGDMNFSNVLKEGFGVEKEFQVPDIQTLNETKNLDLSSINEQLNQGVTFAGTIPNEPSSSALTVQFVSMPGMSFESVTYSKGYLIVDVNAQTIGGYSFGGYATGDIDLWDDATGQKVTATFEDGIARLDISGMELKQDGMKIQFKDDSCYGSFQIRIDPTSKMSKAKNLTLPTSYFNIPEIKVTFPLALSEDMSNVVIEEGSLKVTITTGESWSENVISDYSIDVSGGFDCHVDKANPEAQLVGKALQNSDIEATAQVDVTLVNANIDFDNPPLVSVNAKIDKVSAEIAMPEGFETNISQNMDVPEELKNYVQKIKWKKVGFNVVAQTNLPKDNDIGINIRSSAFGLTDTTTKTIYGGRKEGDADYKQVLSFVEVPEEGSPLITIFDGEGAIDKIDITGTVDLPGAASGKLAISSVSPGATYKVSIEIIPVFDWETASVKLPDGSNFEGDLNTSINKKAMFSSLGDDIAEQLENIQIAKMPLYVFASIPNVLSEGVGFGGTIKTYYGKQEGDTITPVTDAKYIIGSATGPEDLDFKPMPKLEKNEAGEVKTDFRSYKDLGQNFLDALNTSSDDPEASLCISYNVGLSGANNGIIDLDAEKLQQMQEGGTTSISIDVVLILSMDFTLKKPIELDLMDFMNKSEEEGSNGSSTNQTKTTQERDLLKRSQEDYDAFVDNYGTYIEAIKSVSIEITETTIPIYGTVSFGYNLNGAKNDDGSLKYQWKQFGNGKTTSIGIDDTSEFLETYPLEPKLKIMIGADGDNTFGLLRKTDMGGKIKAKIVANKDKPIQVYPFNGQNNGGEE